MKYQVSVFIETGAVVTIEANSPEEAEKMVEDSMGENDLEDLDYETVHRATQVIEVEEA